MTETVTRSGTGETRRGRPRFPGMRVGLGGGLVLLLSALGLSYILGVGDPAEQSSADTVEASLTIPAFSRSTTSNPQSGRPAAASGTEKLPNSNTSPEKGTGTAPASSGATRDDVYRRLLVGKWETERSGHRELTVRADGTATMVVRLTGVNAVLFGKKLTFWIKWTVQDGKLVFSTTGGEPASRIKVITVMYGTNRTQQIRSLTKNRLLLIDEEGDPDHDYRRIAANGN